jgi:hypothetical protein
LVQNVKNTVTGMEGNWKGWEMEWWIWKGKELEGRGN